MNWNQIKGGWQQLAGQVRGNWNKLTEEELNTITANRDQLISFLQVNCGYERSQAEQELDKFTQGRTSQSGAIEAEPLRHRRESLYGTHATYIGFGRSGKDLRIE